MHTHTTPFLGHQSAQTSTHPPIRLPQAALPHWTRPLIRPTQRPRVYQVRSASRADLTHEVDMIAETCGYESWVFQNREAFPVGHDLRACCHIKDVEDYEREQAGIALAATAELVRCVVCRAPAVPGGIHCRVTSWGRGYCSQTASRASQAVDELCGEAM